MKLSWGYRIAILYSGFAVLIIFFVYRSTCEKIDLVSTDYYEKELQFQSQISSAENNNSLAQPLQIMCEGRDVAITYPAELRGSDVSGTITLFRPSDNLLDQTFAVHPDQGFRQIISGDKLVRGMYHVQVRYTGNGKEFYSDKKIIIQ